MWKSISRTLLPRRHQRSLGGKLLLPILGLMLLSLLGSTLAFVAGTALTQNRLLEQQTAAEAARVTQGLQERAATAATAAELLVRDPMTLRAINRSDLTALQTLNSRAVVMRDRFALDLVQLYDAVNTPRTNLVLPTLYRESSLLGYLPQSGSTVQVIADHVLLLARADMPDGAGIVIVGVDLGTELHRLASAYRLSSELVLEMDGAQLTTNATLPATPALMRRAGLYLHTVPFTLNQSAMTLLLARSTHDITPITLAGLGIIVSSALVTTLLLSALSVAVTRAIVSPVQQLAAAAAAVAGGDLQQQVQSATWARFFAIGDEDELGVLATAFNSMVQELRGLYTNLEGKVQARTQELTLTAAVARAASSSLDVDEVLRNAVEMIREHLQVEHVSVYLIDTLAQVARLQEATGEEGAWLKSQQFQVGLDTRSMVGHVAATGHPRIAQDVRREPYYLSLPQFAPPGSAAALPLKVGGNLVGVLYVQVPTRQAFSDEMVSLLLTLGDQIAIGVQNAQLYARQRETATHLAEVNRLKSQFLANMSHELRTPLNSIIGFSRLLAKQIEGPLNETQAQEVQIIYDSGKHLLGLVNDILDISKINAGMMDLAFTDVNLSGLIESVLSTAQVMLKDKPITLHTEITDDLPLIQADERRVRQILLNLLSNAAKFTDTGEVRVRAWMREVFSPHSRQLEPFVEISIRDSGIGIPKNRQADIFEEFTQVDATSTRRTDGTGLGLPITRKLVELHGGRIWVESQPGQGSTFTFRLPVRRAQVTLPVMLKSAA